MLCYHGTTYHDFKRILSDGFIHLASKANSPYINSGSLQTEYGYVYLVGNVIDALEYATMAASQKSKGGHLSERSLIVICLDLTEHELEEDGVDGLCPPTTYKNGPFYRIKRPIKIREIEKISAYKFISFQESCDVIDRWVNDPSKVDQVKWCRANSDPIDWNTKDSCS